MEIHEDPTEHSSGKDTNTEILLPDSLLRLWNLRILLYTGMFLWATVFLYRVFVIEVLETIHNLNVSPSHFIWRTYNEGIGVLYMCCYLLLLILFLIELAVCEFCTLYGTEDVELIQISKRIRIGITLVAILIVCFVPFLLK